MTSVYPEKEENILTNNGTQLVLTRKKLTEFPASILSACVNLQFCYLDDNEISDLPDTFFEYLPKVQWLDLRRNNLVKLPTAGLAGHQHLQVVLLQSNLIKELPPQLATIPNLRGLQVSGNPIENVPYEILAGGLLSIIKYLRKLLKQQDTILPVSETIIMNNASKEGGRKKTLQTHVTQKRAYKTKTSSELEATLNIRNCNKSEYYLGRNLKTERKNCMKIGGHVSNTCRALLKRKKFRPKLITAEKIEEIKKEEMEQAQLRETLQRQAQVLQRIKDVETVKQWRQCKRKKLLDNFQVYPSNNVMDRTPFDIDPDMRNMLCRVDIYKSLKEWEELQKKAANYNASKNKAPISVELIENQIEDIGKKLREINLKVVDDKEKKREERQNYLTKRVAEINKLRRALKNLHGRNLMACQSERLQVALN